MGQGGYIALTNGTKYQWKRTNQHQNQMNSWNFPEAVPAERNHSVYVEWNETISRHTDDDTGEVSYELGDTGLSFQVQASVVEVSFSLRVQFTNLQTLGNPKGSTLNLGWVHDGFVAFILAGEKGNFTSTNLPSNSWMHDNLNLLGERSLMHLCIPGSHDAGMSTYGNHTWFGCKRDTTTQTKSIVGQLLLGARYFDIRPVIRGGEYFTGHYSYIRQICSLQGANGQSMESVINEVNDFTATNKELIILDFSNDRNTDVGHCNWRSFTQDQWYTLLQMLEGIKYLCPLSNPSGQPINLTAEKLKTFIGKDTAAVLVVLQPNESFELGAYEQKGFYMGGTNFDVFNKYSGTNDLNRMVQDQLTKMKQQRPKTYFLLSWTLTQSSTQAAFCTKSVLQLANKANPKMYDELFNKCSSQCYPNILFIDNFDNSNITALAMAINIAFAS